MFAAAVFDWLLNYAITSIRYGFCASGKVRLFALIHLLLLVAAMVVFRLTQGWVTWVAGAFVLLISAGVSIHYLYKETNIFQNLTAKLRQLGQ